MDTRTKIIPQDRLAELASGSENGHGAVDHGAEDHSTDHGTVTAAGWFDVLQAAHGERLAAAKGANARLVVFVYDDNPRRRGVLDIASRAQMVAALAAVDAVVICGEAEAASLAANSYLPPPLLIEDAMPRDIVADVLQKHHAK